MLLPLFTVLPHCHGVLGSIGEKGVVTVRNHSPDLFNRPLGCPATYQFRIQHTERSHPLRLSNCGRLIVKYSGLQVFGVSRPEHLQSSWALLPICGSDPLKWSSST